ncbi:MAG: hypothetical protein C0408_04175 [Odoribacter sp.]|nr:hypothetical protein [Odoribacter sp.]
MKQICSMKKLIIIYLFIIFPAIANCQTEKQLVPADLKQQTVVTEPVTLRKGFFRGGILLNYRVADKYFDNSGIKEYYVTNTWGSKSAYNLILQYGLSNRLQIDLLTEYLDTKQESQTTEIVAGTNTTLVKITKQKGLGFGDSHLSLKYQFFTESRYKVSLTGGIKLTIPTGEKNPKNIISSIQYDLPVGDGTYALGLTISGRSIVYPYSFSGFLSFTNNFQGTKLINPGDLAERTFRTGNLMEGGLSANLHLNEWIVLGNEINYSHEGEGEIENIVSGRMPASWAVSYMPSLIFQVKRFRLGESVRIPLKGKNVPADPLYVVMIQYVF